MIKTLRELLFGKKSKNAFSHEINVIKQRFKNLKLENSRLFHIDGFVYSEISYNKFRNFLEEKMNYESAIKELQKDLMLDSVYIYYLENDNKSFIITFYDPFEYAMDSTLLDIIEVSNGYLDISNKENLLK